MTKKEKDYFQEKEKELWRDVMKTEKEYGDLSQEDRVATARWNAIYMAMVSLGLKKLGEYK